ncbi:MAG: CHRD domain-containing protein [Chloroflexota bacterium]
MRKLGLLIAPVMIFGVVSVAPSARAASTKMTLTAHLSGRSEIGAPGPRAGTGTATVTVTMSTGRLCYQLKVSGFKLPALAAHIHAGRAGKNGPIVVPFPMAPNSRGKASACTRISARLAKAITGHPTSYYVNVHTAAYPGGAIRGQLGGM